ncbi:MAG: PQQ-binding-like beta-propeller repeat protein [Verrucomicrobiota bacterium]
MSKTPLAWRRLLLAAGFHGAVLLAISIGAAGADWPMFGRDKARNPVTPEKNQPLHWDARTGENIKWKAKLGSMTFAAPVVANGLVWIGTNNEYPRDPSLTNAAGVLMCFRERDGKFLYQYVSPARPGPTYNQTRTGISCSPLIEGDRLWFVTTGAEVVCLDIGPLRLGEGMPTELWKLHMMDELGVLPRQAVMGGGGMCSIAASYRDLIYVVTGNGTDRAGANVPAPFAPALVGLNKNTGKVVWEDNSSGAKILFVEWGSPLVIEVGGQGQVIAPQGDGWIRSFDALTGKLIWKFDINRKDGQWPMTRGFFSTPPVFYRDRIYIAIGNYIEFGDLPGRLCSIDPTNTGDISIELEDGPGKGKPNPNSGAVWHFDGIHRTMSTVAIHDGLVIAPDFAGFLHCLDADTGRTNWTHDMKAHIFGSPLIADGRIYVADEDGDIWILVPARRTDTRTPGGTVGAAPALVPAKARICWIGWCDCAAGFDRRDWFACRGFSNEQSAEACRGK